MSKINPKIIAHYLPQFHRIPENDKWWGEGFTEWVNVRKSKPLYRGHKQPRVPFNDNYYSLNNTETLIEQSKIAQKYNIAGFCFYHYWFNGKLLLEKPVKKFIKEKSIKTEFCFSWGNEKWTRAWDGHSSQILIDQNYGGEKNWKAHFEYLLPYFQDERYIKVDEKPLFIIYRSTDIQNLESMKEFWNKLALDNGFNGIHIVSTLNGFDTDERENIFDSYLLFEPLNTLKHNLDLASKIKFKSKSYFHNSLLKGLELKKLLSNKKFYNVISYQEIWDKILSKPLKKKNRPVYPGAFVEWDNTARKKNRATIIEFDSPCQFVDNFKKLFVKAKKNNSQFLFINAWNEWAEGAYLEPDNQNKFNILENIKRISLEE